MADTVNLLNVPNEILQKNVLAYCAKDELYNLSQVRLWKTCCNYGENKLLCLSSLPHFIRNENPGPVVFGPPDPVLFSTDPDLTCKSESTNSSIK